MCQFSCIGTTPRPKDGERSENDLSSAGRHDDPGAGMTPDTIPWTENGKPYYDSEIIYYAVEN